MTQHNYRMEPQSICVLGGTGFVGRHLLAKLASYPHKVTVLSRRPEKHRDLSIFPNVKLVAADCHNPTTLDQYFYETDCVINLVGILNEKGDKGKGFRKAHVELVESIVTACQNQQVPRLLHMSALKADGGYGPSHYLMTKGEAEEIVHAAGNDHFLVTTFQPSVIFGTGDGFFNRFAQILRLAPYFVPLACPRSRFQPVYVGDVCEAMVRCLHNKRTANNRYTLCGDKTYTLRQLVEYTAKVIGLKRKVIGLGKFTSKIQARLLEMMPGQPMSRDNFRSLQVDSTCDSNGLDNLHILPSSVEAIVPGYLGGDGVKGKYEVYRRG